MIIIFLYSCIFMAGVFVFLSLPCLHNIVTSLKIPSRVMLNIKLNKPAVCAFAAFVVVFAISGRIILAIISGGAAFYLAAAYRSSRLSREAETFESQIVEALSSIAGSVKSGHSLLQALESASVELKDPISRELLTVINAVKLGAPMDSALLDMAARNQDKALKTIVISLNIARETGGSLGEALARISESVSERKRMRARIFALTSQGRASGKVMSGVPFFLLAILYLMEPDMTGLMFSTTPGNLMLAAVVGMILAGGLLIKKITSIDM